MKVDNKVLIGGGIAAVVGAVLIGKKIYDDKKRKEVENIGVDEEPVEEKETIVNKAVQFAADHQAEIVVATQTLGLVGAGLGVYQTVHAIRGQKQAALQQKDLLNTMHNIDDTLYSINSELRGIGEDTVATAVFTQAAMPVAPRVAMEEYHNRTVDGHSYDDFVNVLQRISKGEIK